MKKIEFITDKQVIIDGETFFKAEPVTAAKPPEPEFKVGQWIFKESGIIQIYRINRVGEDRLYSDDGYEHNFITDVVRLATPTEIEAHLRKICNKRGYRVGIKVLSVRSGEEWAIESNEFDYHKSEDLLYIDNIAVYEVGKWAEIVPDKKKLPKTKDELACLLQDWLNTDLDSSSGDSAMIAEFIQKMGYED
jgi:hypothetical protein